MSKYTKPNQNNQGQGENSALSAIRAYREGAQGKTGLQAISEYRAGLAQNKSAAGVQKQTASGLDAIRAYREKITPPSASKPVQDQQIQQPQQKIYYGEDTISQWYDDSPNGALYSQMFEYPEEHRNKMADMQVQRLQQKMQAAEKEVASAEARADVMLKRSEELSVVAGNIERLKQEYEQTGDEVKLQAYLIASENYNQKVQAYNADLQKLQKDEKVYDTYNQAYANYERARLMQEQRMAAQAERDEKQRVAKLEQIRKLMDEDPAAGLVLADANERQISRELERLEDEKSALIRTGEAVDWDAVDAINEKIKGVEALKEQKLRAEANSKGWNSSGEQFADRAFNAIAAGGHSGLAGLAAAVDTVFNPVEYLVGTTLGNVADMLGSEDLKKTAEAWTQASKEYENAEPLRGQAEYYADQATERAGKIDGWILNNLQSVGGMMFDAATMGMASAAGGAAGVTTGKIMAVRAAGNGMLDAAEKGYSTTEQLLVGAANGALEYISEKMFGGNPIYDTDGGFVTDALAKVIKNQKILRLMYSKGFDIAAEGLEEFFVELVNPVAEGMITNTEIQWASPADLANAFAGGVFISLLGSGAQVMATEISGAGKAQRQAVRDAGAMIRNADAVQDLILEGLEAKKGTEAYELAAKMQNKLDSGEAISTMEIGRLLMANQEAIEAGYLTEDTKVEPDAKAPKGALADPEQGFYAIRVRKTEDGRNGYRLVHVKPDGSIAAFDKQTNDLFTAKTAAEVRGMNIRHIGTEQQLYEAAIEEEAEYVNNHTYEEAQVDAEGQIATEPADPRNDSEFENTAETENTAQAGGIDWVGNDYGKGVETNGRNETAVDRRAQGVETAAQRLGQSGNAARSGGYPAGSEDQRKARRTEAVSRRREEANRIRTYAADHGIPLRSAKDIGLRTGTEIKNLRVLPRGFDKNVDDTIDLIESAGLQAVIVSGPVQVEIDGEERYMNGVIHNGVVYVQADSISAMPQQIAKHEVFHKKAGEDPDLVDRLWDFVRNNYDGAEIRRRYNQYYEAYKDVYTDADPDTLRHMMQEELLADAYAEYERYGDETLPGLTEEAQEQAWRETRAKTQENGKEKYSVSSESIGDSGGEMNPREEVRFSMERNEELMTLAIEKNKETECAEKKDLEDAEKTRKEIADRMRKIKADGLVALPEDVEGNTYIANSSYDGTEENTTICPRSLAAEAFMDAVSEYLGRPLTKNEQIYISQDLQGRTLTPECLYCYVATDRKAYRAFLGEWVKQRDAVIEKLKENPDADVSRSGALYNEFRDGRKDTDHMYGRFKMWVDTYKSGAPMVSASHLANINKLMGDIESEFGAELKPQIVDAMKYAQSASWAKKRISYVAYNGHILTWKQNRINRLNSHYGLRMYSFSDFHPAFVLENMQIITDASVRGLKMLGYTKDIDFVKIFAPTGMNINVSVFGFAYGGEVFENALQGAPWKEAQKLREQYPNVGVTFVATNDDAIRWAMAQEWIDVVIPYHLVRTGVEVAKALEYTNYTAESSDTKTPEWKKGDAKYIPPTVHNNDKEKYLEALEKNHLRPRFERFKDDPNYMKLVNECRRPASESEAVKPVFDKDEALAALDRLERDGYYQPIGGSVDRMYEIAAEIGDKFYDAERTGTKPQFSMVGEEDLERYSTASANKERDSAYMEAARSGDMETAQRMVDEAAKAAGYIYKAYHGTNAVFNVFKKDLLGSKNFMASSAYKGFFASKSKETAENYTGLNSSDLLALTLNADSRSTMEEVKERHGFDAAQRKYEDAREKFFDEYRRANGYDSFVSKVVNGFKELFPDLSDDIIKDLTRSFEYDWNTRDSGNGQNHVNRMNSEFSKTTAAEEFEELNRTIFDDWERMEIRRRGYVPNIKNLYLKIEKPFVHDFKREGRDVDFTALIDEAKAKGCDGCIFKNVQDGADFDDIYVVFDNTQLKSADPVTYDDNGNVIPLSERFNDQNDDIRYSAPSEDKARQRAEKNIAAGIGRIMYMPKSAERKLQTGMIRELLEEYQLTGEVNADVLSDAVATAFAEGLVANNEFYETYKPVKDYLRSTPVMISEADQSSIADYNQFRKKAFGTLRIVREGGLPVDVMYQEVQEMAPGLLKPVMVHPADQLVQLYEKAKEIRKVEIPLERAMGEQADQFYEWAEGQILKLLEKELTKYADSVQWKKESAGTAAPQDYEWKNTYDRANERMYDYGQQSYYELPEPGSGVVQEDYIYPEEGGLEWAGQMQAGNWLRDQERKRPEGRFDERTVESEEETGQFVVDEFVPEPVVEEELTEEEKARRGTMREWIQYVMRDGVPPEEFAERMRRSAVGELKGDAKIIADRMEETARKKRGDRENLYRDPEMTDEEYEKLNAAWKAHQEQKAGAKQRETVVRKKDFESTPAMDKLGIKIDGSVTRYRATDMLRGYEKAAREAERMLDKRLKKMHASQEEIMFGKMLADGIMDVNSLNYRAINIERIAEIADYYMAKKSFDDDRLYQRKAEINQANDQIAKDLLTDREAFQPHLSGKLQPFTKMIMNERTPERVIKQIFGAEQGEKIFEFYFRPVWVNGNEMIRFKNRMLRRAQGYTDDKDTVGGFYDQDGKRRQLTEAEWGMAQRLLEGKAVAEEYEKLREDEKSKIAKAARALNDDMSLEEVSEKYQLTEGYQQGLAQAYADYLELNEVADKMDRVIMENAVKSYRQIYNEFYDAYNDFLVSHGHEEIGFIRNYAPHFQKQEVQHGLRAALRSMGVTNDKVTELPSEIAGRTADFKPSKKWNPHAMSRKGSQTDYDLLQGFQQYLDYAAEVFYHTDDVMRLRSAVKFLRGQYAAKEISAEIEGAFADMYKPVEWKTKRLRDVGVLKPDGIYTEREVNAAFEAYTAQLLEKASPESLVKWSEFTTWMENAANVIAGKQSVADRGTEFGGRLLLNAGNKLSSVFAKANVAGNLSSILNQTAQLPLLQVELGKYLEQAAVDIAKGGADADFVDHSDFLTEKKGVDVLTTDKVEKFVMALFKPAQMMDGLVSKLAVRGRFLKALDEGMTDEEAMKVADDFARRVMGSRMKGIRPQGFESKNWIAKMIHVFQLEGSNVFDYMLLSDMPQAVQHVAKTKGKKAAQRYVATTAAYYLVSAAALNAIVGSISGGSPAPFDIIGWLLTFVAGGWGRGDEEFLKTVIDNGTEKLFGERVFDTKRLNKERGFDWAGAVENAGYDVVNDIPFVSNIAGVMGWGDQTMPTVGINEMAEDLWSGVTTIFNQITGGEEKTGLDWVGAVGKSASDILNALSQAAPGGRQAKKTLQAARALILGGRYSGFGKNKKLMYTVDRGIASAAQGLLFGPSAWEETDDYYAGGKSLTAAQTQKAETLKKHGVDVEDTYELYQDFAEINEELNAERISSIEAKQQKRDLIAAMDLTDEQKMTVYMQTLASGDEKSKEKAEAKYTALLQDGVSWAQITDLENEFASFGEDADGDGERDMDSVDYGIARRNAIAAMDLNDWQKLEVFDQYMLDKNSNSYESTRAELETMLDEGLTWDDVTDAHNTYAMINADDTMNATQKATAYAKWADEQGWTDAQIEAAKERYMFWQMIPAEATSYEKFAGAGLSSDNAAKVVEVLSNLEPEAGKKSVSDVQRIEAIADGGFSTEDAKSAIRAILSETQAETFDDLMKSGLTPAQYAQYRRSVYGLEADKNGSKKEKVLNAINKLPISKALKTELYFASGYAESTLDDAPWM